VHDNPYLVPAFFDQGGHVGFVAGVRPWAPQFWAEEEVARFIALQLADRF
jgi:predicted alpha/beta-fold hydrolase